VGIYSQQDHRDEQPTKVGPHLPGSIDAALSKDDGKRKKGGSKKGREHGRRAKREDGVVDHATFFVANGSASLLIRRQR
jgi:hypothetical protein